MQTIKTVLTAEGGQFQSEFKKAQATIDSYHKRIMAVGAALGGSALLAGAISKFNSLRNSIDQLNDQAARLQMPVEEMQRLNAVATMSGASVESLAKAINKSSLTAEDAVKGNEGLQAAYAALGISAKEFLNLGATERLVAISKGFKSAVDKGAAFNAVFKVLGKGAGELIPMLRDGEAGIEAISRRLQVLGGEDVAAVARMNDELDLLSANLDSKMKGALIALRPQIEQFIVSLSEAADGLAVFMDPAGGVGKQGGMFGGVDMLRQIDTLSGRIDEIKAKQKAGVSWYEGPLALNHELAKSVDAVDALKLRYESLSETEKIFANQAREFERIRNSGLGENEVRQEIQAMQDRNVEILRAIEAEKSLTTAAAATADEMAKQTKESEALAKNLEGLQERVGKRIIDAQPPDVKRDFAKQRLAELLAREKAGSVGELRDRVNTAPNAADKLKALKALDEGLDRLEEIKRATIEVQAVEKARTDANVAAFDEERAAYDEYRAAMESGGNGPNPEQKRAREEFTASRNALQLELSGRKDIADKLRTELVLRNDAVELSKRLGITEEQALKLIRERAELQEQINKQRDNKDTGSPPKGRGTHNPGAVTRGKGLHNPGAIRRLPNGPFDMNPGNNLQEWKWNLGPDSPRIESRGSARRHIEEGVRGSTLRQRSTQRQIPTPGPDRGAKLLEQSLEVHREIASILKNFSSV